MEMLSPDHPSHPDEEDLYDSIALLRGAGYDIPVCQLVVYNLLLLVHPPDVGYRVAVSRRKLKIHSLRSFLHLLRKVAYDFLIISLQEILNLGNPLGVFFRRHQPLARSVALMDMIVEARSFLAYVLRKLPAAGSYLIKLAHQPQAVLRRARVRKRAIVVSAVPPDLSCENSPWKCFRRCDLNIRIGLVICQHGVIARTMFFDKIAFQHQSFRLGVNYRGLEPGDLTDHAEDLRRFISGA